MALQSVAWQYVVGSNEIGLRADMQSTPRRIRYRKAGMGNDALERCLQDVASIMRVDFRQRFAEGGPGWLPLKPATVRRKMALGLPKRGKNGQVLRRLRQMGAEGANAILIASGALRDSYGVKNAPGHVEEIDVVAGTVVVGSALPYAGVHQTGAVVGRRGGSVIARIGAMASMGRARVLRELSSALRHRAFGSIGRVGGILPARPVALSPGAKEAIRQRVALYVREIAAD